MEFNHMAQQLNLVYVMHHFHSSPLPPTNAHSNNQLDYQLISCGLLQLGVIRGCGSLTLNHEVISNHVGLNVFVNSDKEAMLSTNTVDLLSPAYQVLLKGGIRVRWIHYHRVKCLCK